MFTEETYSSWLMLLPVLLLIGGRWFHAHYVSWVLLSVVLVSIGLSMGVFSFSWTELWQLPFYAGLNDTGLDLCLWSVFSVLAIASGGLPRLGSIRLRAFCSGALLGCWAAAALGCQTHQHPADRARWMLLSCSGAWVGRIGYPALLSVEPSLWGIALAVLWGVPVWRGAWRKPEEGGDRYTLWVSMGMFVLSWWSVRWALSIGSLCLVVRYFRQFSFVRLDKLLRLVLCSGVVVSVLAATGAIELFALWLEMDWSSRHAALPLSLLISSFVLDPFGSAWASQALWDRILDVQHLIERPTLFAWSASVGAPAFLLWWHRCWKEGKWRFIVQLLLLFVCLYGLGVLNGLD